MRRRQQYQQHQDQFQTERRAPGWTFMKGFLAASCAVLGVLTPYTLVFVSWAVAQDRIAVQHTAQIAQIMQQQAEDRIDRASRRDETNRRFDTIESLLRDMLRNENKK